MTIAPILILGFTRHENILKIIDAIRPHKPKKVYFAVDGPRAKKTDEFLKVAKTQRAIEAIDWECDVRTRFREVNLGLRFAIPDAVTWVLGNEVSVIVIEDDAIPGPEVLQFISSQLKYFDEVESVFHVSGYNLVPKHQLTSPNLKSRFSKYPESYLWGTWSRAWKSYTDDLSGWKEHVMTADWSLKERVIWRINFRMAERDLIHTWAYRWIYAIWENKGMCISPNVNLMTYVGQVNGTHTRGRSSRIEIPVESIEPVIMEYRKPILDTLADAYISREDFKATSLGVVLQSLIFFILLVNSKLEKLHPYKLIQKSKRARVTSFARDYFRPFYRKFRIYASLNSLDRKIEGYLPPSGVFMEAGANDGLHQSNTLFLARRHGWKGILVEPVPRLFERCNKNRPDSFCVNAALVAPEDSGAVIDLIDVDLMSSVKSTNNFAFDEMHIRSGEAVQGIIRTSVSTTGKTISEVITSSGFLGIDFLSIDVEGFELEALKGFTKEEHFPKTILIETKQLELVLEVLNHRYELVEKLSEHDYFLQRKPDTERIDTLRG